MIHISPECQGYLAPTNQYIIEERGFVNMKGKGDIKTYWLCGHVDGPRPRLNVDSFDPRHSNRERIKSSQISLFDAISSTRKGSLVTFDQNNLTNLYKKSLLAKKRVSNMFSSSCNTFSQTEIRGSPKVNKRNWHFKFLNGKFRSNSTNQPNEGTANHILMKETKVPKSMIKSPSFNVIESYANELQTVELINNYLKNSIDVNHRQTTDSLIMESNMDQRSSTGTKSDEQEYVNDEYSEDRPLLSKSYRNANINSQSSLPEEDEEQMEQTGEQTNSVREIEHPISLNNGGSTSPNNNNRLNQKSNHVGHFVTKFNKPISNDDDIRYPLDTMNDKDYSSRHNHMDFGAKCNSTSIGSGGDVVNNVGIYLSPRTGAKHVHYHVPPKGSHEHLDNEYIHLDMSPTADTFCYADNKLPSNGSSAHSTKIKTSV